MTTLALVHSPPPAPLELPERLSMSFLQDTTRCLRMAALKREADTSGEEATVGTVVHEVAALAGHHAARLGVDTLPADDLEHLARVALRNPGEGVKPLSLDGWRAVIALSRRLSYSYDEGPPAFPIGAEYEVYATRELDGRIISARIDRRWFDGTVCWIDDIKSGGKRAAEEPTFQGLVYAWETLWTHPWVTDFWLAEWALPYGGPIWIHVPADDIPWLIEDYLSDLIARLEAAYAAPPLTPTPGSWCDSMCPDRAGCPLPEWAKGSKIRTEDDASRAVDAIVKGRADSRALTRAAKAYLDDRDLTTIAGSGDMEYGYGEDGKCAVRKARREDV